MVKQEEIDRSGLMNLLWDVQHRKSHIGHDDITKIAQKYTTRLNRVLPPPVTSTSL